MAVDPTLPPPRLEPCPWCGNPLEITWRKNNPRASCKTDGCFGFMRVAFALDDPQQVEAWNRRASLTARAAVAGPSAPAIKRLLEWEAKGELLDRAWSAMVEQERDIKLLRAALPSTAELAVIRALIALAHATFLAFEDSEEFEGDHGRCHSIIGQDFDDVAAALDALDELPDDRPGYTLAPYGKAQWALRRLLGIAHETKEPRP